MENIPVYRPSEMAAAIMSIESYPEPTGNIFINENGSVNVKDYSNAIVDVPNSYSASDEGKVVSEGSLVSQSGITVNTNGTVDTTLNNEVVVNVESGSTLISKTITQNGTYDPADDNADGYNEVVVNVQGGGSYSNIEYADELLPNSSDILKTLKIGMEYGDISGIDINRDEEYYLLPSTSIEYELPSANYSHTVYLISKCTTSDSNDHMIVSSPYAQSSGNAIGLLRNGSGLRATVWGTDPVIGTATDWNCMAYTVDVTNKKVRYYLNGEYINELSFNNAGQKVILNRHLNSASDRTNTQVLRFLGIVDGTESDETVIANQEYLMEYYSDIFE